MTIIKAKQKFDSSTLCKIFMVSNQGGMRRSLKTNSLVLIANHIKGRRSQYTENIDGQNIYEDQWVNDIFYYTGMGLKGDQSLEFAQNKTLNESNQNNVNVYLFEVFTDGEFTFTGKVKLCDNPTSITQEDVNGKQRKVYIFPLKVTDSIATIEDKSKNFEEYNNTENTFGLSESNLVNLSKDISSFNLSVRSMNVLKNNNMKTLGDITKVSEYYFSKLPNVGHKTLVEINELLSSHLLSFDMNIDDIDTSVEIDEDEIISSLNLDTENFDLTQRTRNIIRLLNLSKIGHIIEFSESRLLAQKNFGKKSHNELKKLLLSHNLSFDTKIGHLKWDSLENTKKLKQVIEKKEKNIRKKISDINFTTLLDDRDHNIMMKRLQGLSLQEVGDEINIKYVTRPESWTLAMCGGM